MSVPPIHLPFSIKPPPLPPRPKAGNAPCSAQCRMFGTRIVHHASCARGAAEGGGGGAALLARARAGGSARTAAEMRETASLLLSISPKLQAMPPPTALPPGMAMGGGGGAGAAAEMGMSQRDAAMGLLSISPVLTATVRPVSPPEMTLDSLADASSQEHTRIRRASVDLSHLAASGSRRGGGQGGGGRASGIRRPRAESWPMDFTRDGKNGGLDAEELARAAHLEGTDLEALPHLASATYNKGGRIGIYTPKQRSKLLSRWHAKRERRVWRKKIRYNCRKNLADTRIRIKGRFVKAKEVAAVEALSMSSGAAQVGGGAGGGAGAVSSEMVAAVAALGVAAGEASIEAAAANAASAAAASSASSASS